MEAQETKRFHVKIKIRRIQKYRWDSQRLFVFYQENVLLVLTVGGGHPSGIQAQGRVLWDGSSDRPL